MRKSIDLAVLSDEQLLHAVVDVACSLAAAMAAKLVGGVVLSDMKGWSAPGRPLRMELQVKSLALDAADALEWGARSLDVRLSAAGTSCARYLGEIEAIVNWITEPDNPDQRQKRALEFHLAAITSEMKMIRHINKRETNPVKQQGNTESIGLLSGLENEIKAIAQSLDFGQLRTPPKRESLFDKYSGELHRYGFFAMTSEWGSHPGFGLVGFLAERGQPMSWANRTGAQFIRAYLTAGQIWIASRILHRCQEILSWESLERGGLGDALARSHTVSVEVDRRYALLQSRL